MSKTSELLRELEWSATRMGQPTNMGGRDGRPYPACPSCGGLRPGTPAEGEFIRSAIGHQRDCRLWRALREGDA